MKKSAVETLFWSIALPGFGQLLNGKYLKGVLLVACEILINVQAHFNQIILLSFNGKIEAAIEHADYQWLLFYPCFYFFAMFDAYRDAGGIKSPFTFFPFVFSAYFVTTGVFYSSKVTIFGVLLGPVFLPMLFVIPGLLIGGFIKKIAEKISQ